MAGVSVALLSMIERGDHPLQKVRTDALQRFPEAYGMSAQEFASLTGITLISSSTEEPQAPVAPRPRPIPDSLREAVETYGHTRKYADLLLPEWQNYLASFRPRGATADTPEEWLDLYTDLKKHGITPGGN